jgi:diguanylate cyclase (GGDEF)-like protein/PAS domain S-box-containing protein
MMDALDKLSLILDTITDGILVVDSQGVVIYANQAAKSLLERPGIIGQQLAIPITTSNGAPQDVNLIRPSGFAWAEMRTKPIEWGGTPAYVLGLHDITDRKQAEIALQKSEALFQTLARLSPVGIFKTDQQGDCDYVNQRWCDISGLSTEEAIGKGWLLAVFNADRQRVQQEWQHATLTHTPFKSQYRFQHRNGPIRWVIGLATPEYDNDRQFLGYVGTVTDITEIKRNEDHLHQAAAVFESTREGVMITDAERRIQRVNRAYTEITGYSQLESLNQLPSILRSGRHDQDFYTEMWEEIVRTGHWQGEIWNRRKSGEIYPELLSISTIRNQEGEICNYVGVFADITKLKASEKELEFLAHHDPLTNLPNRLLFMSRLQHGIAQAQRQNSQLAVLMLDLDRFKDVNDSFGHLAGDDLLQAVAEQLITRLRAADTVCRLGGDEFVILLEDLNHPTSAANIANDIIALINQPWCLYSGNEVRIGVSIGIALFPEHGKAAAELVQRADTALYEAKNEGRNCYKFFSEASTRAAHERIKIELNLRKAIENEELCVFYQPQIDIANERVIGVEALVRWQTADGELIMPLRFIPVAEETGLITRIGDWVLKQSCLQARQWLEVGLPPLRLAVNISSHQLMHGDIYQRVSEALSNSGFTAEYLELELTESVLMKREKEAIDILQHLHGLGVRLAIDDFGTGYSSLAHLKSFPLNALKIDHGFIRDIPGDKDAMEITATIISMAKNLRMQVTAVGVESQAQLEFLAQHQCDFYQGYYTSRPLSAAGMTEYLQKQTQKDQAAF